MKLKLFLALGIGVILSSCVQQNPEITSTELKKHAYVLAADQMEGRKAGTIGGEASANYIRDEFAKNGLGLKYDNGFQSFSLITDVTVGKSNSLLIDDKVFTINEDFVPFAFSANKAINTEFVFAGYGFDFQTDSVSRNDYEGLDVKGKTVVVFRGDPEMEKHVSAYIAFEEDRSKALVARDHGAEAIVLISPVSMDKKDKLDKLHFDKTAGDVGIPVIQMTRKAFDNVLSNMKLDAVSLEDKLNKTLEIHSFDLEQVVELNTEVVQQVGVARNVVAFIEGTDPNLKKEEIVLGAHYDHLGFGGPESGSRVPDTIAVHNGADDNASGVATLIELAGYFKKNPPKRSITFVAFDAEEMGLIGSKYYVDSRKEDVSNIKAMFNFDMLGRFKKETKTLAVGGTGTSLEAEDIMSGLVDTNFINLSFSQAGYGPSDHAAFYAVDIPVFFFSTGAHGDYHTPVDDVEFLDFESQELVSKYIRDVVDVVANRDAVLTYKEAGVKSRKRHGYRFKVTLGIIPDFAGTVKGGLAIDGVRKGGPAEAAGMKKGDKIIAINGLKVTNIYEYMDRLKTLKEGTSSTIEVERDGEVLVLITQF
jgi:Zn-dependent M28 family amino/carboxypeptidase